MYKLSSLFLFVHIIVRAHFARQRQAPLQQQILCRIHFLVFFQGQTTIIVRRHDLERGVYIDIVFTAFLFAVGLFEILAVFQHLGNPVPNGVLRSSKRRVMNEQASKQSM